jgi:SAM-dependent methyltransferase
VSQSYVGSELELFAGADHWKSYVAKNLAPFLGRRVLEVGGGIGANIPYLRTSAVEEWTSVEPDATQADVIRSRIARGEIAVDCHVICGTIEAIATDARFDAILYLDVLEHIADDGGELARSSRLLAPGGKLVVLAPAHQFLFSPFDKAIGHFRRYTPASLSALSPPGCRVVCSRLLDSAGFFASLANRLVLSPAMPTARQIAFWDNVLVPASSFLDRLTFHRFGKTVILVWRKND